MLLVRVLIVFVEYQVISPLFRITSPGTPPQFLSTSLTTGATYFDPCSFFLARFFFYSFAFRRPFTSAARSILSEKLSARPYIRLGRSTRQRGNQHSGRVHSSLLSYIPLKLPNAKSFTVTLPTPRYTCVPHVQ